MNWQPTQWDTDGESYCIELTASGKYDLYFWHAGKATYLGAAEELRDAQAEAERHRDNHPGPF